MEKTILVGISEYAKECPKARRLLIEKGYRLIELEGRDSFEKEDLLHYAPMIDGAIAGLEPWDEEVFSTTGRLKVVSRFGVGYDTVDLQAAKNHNVIVTNVRSAALSNGVAEFAIGLMFLCAKNYIPMHQAMQQGKWERQTGSQLHGKTIGIVGFGAIGKDVAAMLQGFNVRLLAYDPYPDAETAEKLAVSFVSKQTIFMESDIVTLHIPSLKENHHFVDERTLALMKPTAMLVNTARGMVMDTQALYEALKAQRIRCAGLDVFEQEPLKNSPLCELSNVVLAPHASGENEESKIDVSVRCAMNLIDVLEGRIPESALNI